MDQHIHFVTLATPDLDAARAFYCGGLGWEALLDVPGEINLLPDCTRHGVGLFDAEKFREDIGRPGTHVATSGITFSHNVDSAEAVDALVAAAVRAGAALVKHPQQAAFGGYHGHFADPNGVIWEICHNPGWSVDTDGRVRLTTDI
ncbi:VOC family protein [Rhodococcus hoagii]|nr:VOC family protein [Prescottella equi]